MAALTDARRRAGLTAEVVGSGVGALLLGYAIGALIRGGLTLRQAHP